MSEKMFCTKCGRPLVESTSLYDYDEETGLPRYKETLRCPEAHWLLESIFIIHTVKHKLPGESKFYEQDLDSSGI